MIANIAKYKISDFADGFAGISPTIHSRPIRAYVRERVMRLSAQPCQVGLLRRL